MKRVNETLFTVGVKNNLKAINFNKHFVELCLLQKKNAYILFKILKTSLVKDK